MGESIDDLSIVVTVGPEWNTVLCVDTALAVKVFHVFNLPGNLTIDGPSAVAVFRVIHEVSGPKRRAFRIEDIVW